MTIDLDAIRARQERAHAEVSALCHGKRWQMMIPARPDDDSDLIIGASLRDIHALLAHIADLEADKAALVGALEGLQPHIRECNAQDPDIIGECPTGHRNECGRCYDLRIARALLDRIRP